MCYYALFLLSCVSVVVQTLFWLKVIMRMIRKDIYSPEQANNVRKLKVYIDSHGHSSAE